MLTKLNQIIPNTAKGSFWLGFGLCLLVCLLIVFVVSDLTGFSKNFGGKSHDGYLEIAENIIRANGFVFEPGGATVLHRPPFYPILISPLTLLPKEIQRIALIVLQSAITGGICFLIFKIAQYLFGAKTARTAVIIFVLNPWVYLNAKNPMTPITQGFLYILFVSLIGSSIAGILKSDNILQNRKKIWLGVLATGVAGAALVLSHGAMLAVAITLLLISFIAGILRKSYLTIAGSIISAIIIVILVTPWTYRNWKVLGRFVPVTSNHGFAYFHGLVHWNICGENARRNNESYEHASLRFLGVETDESEATHFWGLKDPELDQQFNKKMKEHILAQPGLFIKKLLLNTVEYYFPMATYPFLAVKRLSVQKLAITIFHIILWALAIIGIYNKRADGKFLQRVGVVLALIALYGIWYLPFVTFIGHSLYTFGTMPFLSIVAALGINTRVLKKKAGQENHIVF